MNNLDVAIEAIVRRVVREELAPVLAALRIEQGHPVSVPAVVPAFGGGESPFLLSERELMQAERLLPETEGAVLRLRVYAARAEAAGSHRAARLHRRRADLMEQSLKGKPEDAGPKKPPGGRKGRR
jgi:hypothetical protein